MGSTNLAETKVTGGKYAAKPHQRGFKGGISPFARYNLATAKLESCQPIHRADADCQNYCECDCECDLTAASE